MMEYRKLGSSDLDVSIFCLGLWGIGGPPWWLEKDDETSIKTMHKAFELGVNFFDTAPAYGCGHSEELVAKALKNHYHEIVVATKVGVRWDDKGNFNRITPRSSILEEIDMSLKRLQTECIDLYQVHWPDPNTPIQETMETLLEIQRAGKIRYIGISNYSLNQIDESLKYVNLISYQPRYNLFDRSIEGKVADFCIRHNIGIIAYSPLASGILSGKYTKDAKFTDWRGGNMSRNTGFFKDTVFPSLIDKTEKLKVYAQSKGRTVIELAIAWVMRKPGITAAIVGSNTPEQVAMNVKAVDWKLTAEEIKEIEEIVK